MGWSNDKSEVTQPDPQKTGREDSPRMGTASAGGPPSGKPSGRYTSISVHSSSIAKRQSIPSPPKTGDHLRDRHPKGIWPEDLDDLEEQIIQAFQQADPAKAWELAQQLLSSARSLMRDLAKARFEANFGTPICEECDGLRAGKNVIATCYQMRLCYYTNVKEGATPKQRAVLENLLDSKS
jgi:hypothetical protein